MTFKEGDMVKVRGRNLKGKIEKVYKHFVLVDFGIYKECFDPKSKELKHIV